MAVISFTEDDADRTWCVAAWAFRQVLDDVISQHPEDAEMAETFDQSKTHSGLILYRLKPEFAARIASAIEQVATGILSGEIRSGILDQPYGDAPTVDEYRKGLQGLLESFPSSQKR